MSLLRVTTIRLSVYEQRTVLVLNPNGFFGSPSTFSGLGALIVLLIDMLVQFESILDFLDAFWL